MLQPPTAANYSQLTADIVDLIRERTGKEDLDASEVIKIPIAVLGTLILLMSKKGKELLVAKTVLDYAHSTVMELVHLYYKGTQP